MSSIQLNDIQSTFQNELKDVEGGIVAVSSVIGLYVLVASVFLAQML